MPIVEFGFYKKQLSEFYKRFPPENILILESEEFFADKVANLKKVEKFLNIEAHEWDENELFPINQGSYCTKVPETAGSELASLYFQANAGLEELVGRKFSWL